ncbi:MAG TPA: GMC oxidoreductase [Gaiellaceae bacterium]|nr:GMC oxidoreductase [Gaiellaceae bacterium]
MLVDARSLAAGASLEADVCVVGAGPAGLAVTSELDGRGPSVVVLAGSAEATPGEVSGDPYPAIVDTRAGGVGGTAALWDAELSPGSFGARYAPLAPIDFEERDGIPGSGWPFDRSELDPFYARAHDLCVAGPYDYEPADAEALLSVDGVATGLFRFGLAEPFTQAQRDRLAQSDAVRVLTDATVTRIGTAEGGGAVSHVEAGSEPGQTFSVRARAYVLAAGGIENPRLLLLSGLGAGRDLVGRCFMDHPTIRCRLELEGDGAELGFYDVHGLALGRLELPEETMRREGLLNGGFILAPARDRELRATTAAKAMVDAMHERRLPPQPFRTVGDALAGIDSIAFAAHRRLARAAPALAPSLRLWRRSALLDTLGLGPVSGWSSFRQRSRAYDLYHVIEQAPDPERRVTLGSERDRFGLPLPSLRWFVGARELESAERAQELMRAGFDRHGLGRLRTGRELAPDGDLLAAVHPSAHHHLGTTRMHEPERHGVVDADARVHGLANLFVAGGSVFPTSGFVNPTLTIVALALRLGAHLRQDVMR